MPGTLTHSPADVVRRLLVDAGLGTDPPSPGHRPSAWPVYAHGDPGVPDSRITVSDTTGTLTGWMMPDGEADEGHGILVRISSAAFGAGWTKARAIAVAFDTDFYLAVVAIGNSRYEVWSVDRTTDVLDLGVDTPSSKRRGFTINALVSVIQVA